MLSVVRYGGILYVNDTLTQAGKLDCIHEKYGMKTTFLHVMVLKGLSMTYTGLCFIEVEIMYVLLNFQKQIGIRYVITTEMY